MKPKVNVIITGLPGCGKSTLVNRFIAAARQKGIRVGGISTPEFRLSTGKRGGFFIQDISTGAQQIMASVDVASSVSVGRYGVNLESILEVGVSAIDSAVAEAEIIIIDEIGKMELAVPEFLISVQKALDSPKPVLGTIGIRLKTPFTTELKNRSDVSILMLTPENRNQIYQEIENLFGQ